MADLRAARPGRAAAWPGSRGHGCGMLSPEPGRSAALPKPSEIRSAGLSHLHRAQRRKQQGEQKGGGGRRRGPNKRVPQRTLAGSNPAWALFQHRKLPAVRLESDAGRFINRQQDRDKKRKSGNRKERLMRAAAHSV